MNKPTTEEIKAADEVIEGRMSIRYYSDVKLWGRIWKGPFPSEDNFHYAFCDGELDPNNRLIWIASHTSKPRGIACISLPVAIALMLENRWPGLTTEGWEEVLAIAVISGMIDDSGLSRPGGGIAFLGKNQGEGIAMSASRCDGLEIHNKRSEG